jgi:hypothetical protein
MAMASSKVLAMPEAGMGMPNFSIIFLKRSRSSAMSIVSGEVPMMRTPAWASCRAMFRGV